MSANSILVSPGILSRTASTAILQEKVGYQYSLMEHIEIISKSLRGMAWMFALQGILAVVFGFLILLYPPLLAILVGVVCVIAGIVGIIAAIMIGKFSKIKTVA